MSGIAEVSLSSDTYNQTEIGKFPIDWEVVSLQDAATFGGGTTPPRNFYDKYYVSGVHPWVKTLDLNNGVIAVTEENVTDAALAETSLKKHPAGSVLIAMYGGFNQIGRTGLIAIDAAINQALVAVIPRKGKLVSEYLLYNFNYKVEYWKGVASSSRKDPNITSNDVKNYLLPLPTVKEQTAIANALSDVDALIGELEKLIAKKQAIKTATMQQLLTGRTRLPPFALREDGKPKGTKPSELGEIPEDWERISIGRDTVLKARIGWQALTTKEYQTTGDIYLVTGTDFDSGAVKWERCFYVSEWRYKQDQNIQLRNDDVLITKDGTIGKVGYVTALSRPATLNSGVFVVRPKNNNLMQRFLFYVLTSRVFDDFINRITAGSTITHLYQKDFVNFEFSAPCIEEQTAIATILSDMDEEIQALEQRLGKTRQIKQGMMQELLTGKTRLIQGSEAR
ncbi:restriction endonuclease subunit S [Vibrio cholerae]